MTINKNMLGVVFGAVLLAGCADDVMQQRKFVPADDPSARSAVSDVAPDPADAPEKRQAATVEERNVDEPVKQQSTAAADESKPAPRRSSEFKPMTEKFDDSGVSADESEVAAAPGEYIVRPGDSLGKIAARHHVRLSALMKANNLTEKNAKRLRVGQKLVIPGGKGGKTAAPATKQTAKKSGKTADGGKASIQPGEYVVKAGDTPERIARRAKVRLSDLMAANKMTEADAKRLRIGQKLVIPGKGGKTAAPATKQAATKPGKTKTAAPAAKQTANPQTVTTAPAAPAETDKNDAAILNEMQNTQAVPAADQNAGAGTPAAPAGVNKETPWVDVTEDISLVDFAKKYNTTPEALRAANDGLGDVIKKGETIFLPR